MPDIFLHLPNFPYPPPSPSQSTQSQPPQNLTLLFFIPGNPGLLEYYIPFLTLLTKQNSKWTGKGKSFGVAGVSLGGFEKATSTSTSESTPSKTPNASSTGTPSNGREEADTEDLLPLYPPSFPRKQTGTYTLREQIELTYARLTTLTDRLRCQRLDTDTDTDTSTSTPLNIEVIVTGHSVGAYIALELVNLYHQRLHINAEQETPSSSPSPSTNPISMTIPATILLTPTLLNISHSPSGLIATPLLTYLPLLPILLQLASSTLTTTLPTSWTRSLVRRVTGMKSKEMVDVTVEFLGRSGAVRQALELAEWEMREIRESEWDAAVWSTETSEVDAEVVKALNGDSKGEEEGYEDRNGTHTPASPSPETIRPPETQTRTQTPHYSPPTHHLLFAREDHWIASETRETIIKSTNGRAKIIVDGGDLGLVHAWCLEQSELVAGIVSGWIEEMGFGGGSGRGKEGEVKGDGRLSSCERKRR